MVEQKPPETGPQSRKIRMWDVYIPSAFVVLLGTSVLVEVWHPTGANAPTEWLGLATGTLALVTTILAIATVSTARQSARAVFIAEEDLRTGRRLVTETRRQSLISEKALSESRRPVLIPCVDRLLTDPKQVNFYHDGQRSMEVQDFPFVLYFSDSNSDWLVVKIRNVGGGPAIVENGPTNIILEREAFDVNFGNIVSRVIGPGDEVPLTFRMPRMTERPRFWVTIRYRDLSYERRYRGRIVFDQSRPQPMLTDATVEDLNFQIDQGRDKTDDSLEDLSS